MSCRHLLTPGSPGWPARLGELSRPPAALHVLGALPPLPGAVAIVGTRRPDARAAAFTRRLAHELAATGRVIVSGGALGVDSEAHLGALEAGGTTVAVLATGLAPPYPARNRPLFARIAERGALLSEQPDGSPGYRGAFLARNRLVAALADVVVVVQAPLPSGALSTAAHARRLGRRLMVVPHAPWELRGEGCLVLLAGAAEICRGSADVLSQRAPAATPLARRRGAKHAARIDDGEALRDLDEDERTIIEALAQGPLTADELCDESALAAPRVQRAILMLLLAGRVEEVGSGSGRYARTERR